MAGLLDTPQPGGGGLLDFIMTDPASRSGLALLAAGSPKYGRGLLQAAQAQDQMRAQQMQQKLMQSQIDENTYQAQERKLKAAAAQQAQQRTASFQNALGGALSGASGTPALNMDSMLPPEMRAGTPTIPGRAAQQVNYQALMAQYPEYADQIKNVAAAADLGRAEVARTVETTDAQGRPVTMQLDKFGKPVGEGLASWKAPISVNQGSKVTFADPVTLQPRGSFNVEMSAAERDASARGWASNALAREKFAHEKAGEGKPIFNSETGSFVYAPSAANPQGRVEAVPGFNKPLNDTQSKALLFGTRMQEADKILSGLEAQGKSYSTPGANTPFIGGAVNMVNSAAGQMLDQAKRDYINATLRRESGAAIAASEYSNAEKQYFPQIGDSKEVIAQKARNRALATKGILSEVPEAARARITPKEGGASGSWDAPAGGGGFRIIGVQ